MNIPIIRLEVEGMKHTIQTALMQHSVAMDEYVQQAVEQYCTDENLRNVVFNAARNALDAAIKSEVDNFFRYGEGRKVVAAAVKESILTNTTYTALDGQP